jgi:hypothetical protein
MDISREHLQHLCWSINRPIKDKTFSTAQDEVTDRNRARRSIPVAHAVISASSEDVRAMLLFVVSKVGKSGLVFECDFFFEFRRTCQ